MFRVFGAPAAMVLYCVLCTVIGTGWWRSFFPFRRGSLLGWFCGGSGWYCGYVGDLVALFQCCAGGFGGFACIGGLDFGSCAAPVSLFFLFCADGFGFGDCANRVLFGWSLQHVVGASSGVAVFCGVLEWFSLCRYLFLCRRFQSLLGCHAIRSFLLRPEVFGGLHRAGYFGGLQFAGICVESV
jgi:hypothetical protein